MPTFVDALVKRIAQLEKTHAFTTKLAVQTDLDIQREPLRHQVVFHLRGEVLLSRVEELYKVHQARLASGSEASREHARARPWWCFWQSANRADETLEPFWTKAFNVVLDVFKDRCQVATEAGKARVSLDAVPGLFSLHSTSLLAGFHLHGPAPPDDAEQKVSVAKYSDSDR